MRNVELKVAKNSVKRIYITLEDGEPSIDIINYAKRVRKKQKKENNIPIILKQSAKGG